MAIVVVVAGTVTAVGKSSVGMRLLVGDGLAQLKSLATLRLNFGDLSLQHLAASLAQQKSLATLSLNFRTLLDGHCHENTFRGECS